MGTSGTEDPPSGALDGQHRGVVIVGGGQAGLSMSWHLRRLRIDHVVLERNEVAHEWKTARWDSFCLVTPNWQCQLPGFSYPGDDPDGFMMRGQIVEYLEEYAASFDPPLLEGIDVTGVRPDEGGSFEVTTSHGTLHADEVVVATGGYHLPLIPRSAEHLPDRVAQLHSSTYRNADQLPSGPVVVVGSGQSGAQIAEDLLLAGREVHLAVGSAPRVARVYRGRDVVAWLDEMGYYRMPVTDHPLREGVRGNTNHYVTGRDGGRDIDLRLFATRGMRLYGRLVDIADGRMHFGNDLARNLDQADAVSESIKDTIDGYITRTGAEVPTEARYTPVWTPPADPPRELDLDAVGVAAVIWCIGYQADYRWINVPIFNGRGYPTHRRGITSQPGFYFLGLPWLHTWGSGRFSGVATDAEHLARVIALRGGADLAGAGSRGLNALALGS
ncbi:MAG: MSMEG_0569 family flavin-dependent oxidoreductase [Frankia sp.]